MSVKWNGDAAKLEIEDASADGLLRGAVFFQTQHKHRVNVSNPRPYLNSSKPGEYMRARTGFGRDNCAYEPITKAEIAKEQAVRIGFFENAKYMLILEIFRRRKGLLDTLKDIKKQLATIITATKAP